MAFTNVTNIPVYNALRQNTGAAGGAAAARGGAAARRSRGRWQRVARPVAAAAGGGGEGEEAAVVAAAVAAAAARPSTTRAGTPKATSRAGPISSDARASRLPTASSSASTSRPGRLRWRVPLGTLEDDHGAAGKDVGATNIGPSLATRSGLLFIGATSDERFRAFDQRTGASCGKPR